MKYDLLERFRDFGRDFDLPKNVVGMPVADWFKGGASRRYGHNFSQFPAKKQIRYGLGVLLDEDEPFDFGSNVKHSPFVEIFVVHEKRLNCDFGVCD